MALSEKQISPSSSEPTELFGKNEQLASYLMPNDPNSAQARAVWKQLEPHLPEILNDFYKRLGETPMMAEKLGNDPATPVRLSNVQTKHWEAIFNNNVDRSLEEEALKIGSAHVRIGLTSDWFIAGYGRVLMEALPAVLKAHRFTPQRAAESLRALVARMFLDMAMANEAYANQVTDKEAAEWREDNDYQNLRTISGSMSDMNEVTLNLAVLSDSSKRSTQANESIAAAVEQLVASIKQLSETSQNAADDAVETNNALRDGVEDVAKARRAITSVSEAADRSSESLTSLQAAAGEISAFMDVIQSIADQTNLLALNATIEAARAGEAGKGFAVVASEVKDLANQAASATEDVAARIRTLQEGIEQISAHFNATKEAIETGEATLDSANASIEGAGNQMNAVAARMSEVAQILDQQEESATEISSHVSGLADMTRDNTATLGEISDLMQRGNNRLSEAANIWFSNTSGRSLCEMAKIDHILFKKRVVDTVLGRGNWKSSEVPDHHNCRLGKWYDSIEDADLLATPAFKALKDPHSKVHATAVQALVAHERGDTEGAIEGLKALDLASKGVIDNLDTVSRYLHSKESISERRKKNRQPVYGEKAKIRAGDLELDTHVLDVADRGIGVEGISISEVGQKFEIDYKGVKQGVVRWSNGKRGGIEFES
jgi:methyl-accepting chemotaxis protein